MVRVFTLKKFETTNDLEVNIRVRKIWFDKNPVFIVSKELSTGRIKFIPVERFLGVNISLEWFLDIPEKEIKVVERNDGADVYSVYQIYTRDSMYDLEQVGVLGSVN